jgi:signal transduction histidine kinase
MTVARKLKALIVEDNEADAELLVMELKRGGYAVTQTRVQTAEDMRTALESERWDVVFSDFVMPTFSAPEALEVLKATRLDIPFLIVSGTIGEETAVEAMRAGAHDFMSKNNLQRLLPALERELREASLRAERHHIREQLMISDRMASVGALAAGVAHEINNPLAAVLANLDFAARGVAGARKRLEEARERQQGVEGLSGVFAELEGELGALVEPLQDACDAAGRVRNIVRDLKIFSRSEEEELRHSVDVVQVVESSLRIAWNEVRHRARVTKDYAKVPLVFGNEARLGQVFLNLIINAAHAIDPGRATQNEIKITIRQEGMRHVVVEVVDTGCGIPEEQLPRIFDAFFTTKPVGIGSGLGLTICHGILSSLGGDISIESKVGRGTLVRTRLPVSELISAEAPLEALVPPSRRRGRILVVDDEPMICSAVRRMLSSEHDVIAVRSGREALALLAAGEVYDAILCDLMMPDMTGIDLYGELVQHHGERLDRVVFMTGGAFTSSARAFLDGIPNERLEKPFDQKRLRQVLHALVR